MPALIRRKWRPSLALVVASVLGLVLCLPLAGLFLFNFYGKQLVQQTEESLIAQTALLAALFEDAFRANNGDPQIGFPLVSDREITTTRLNPIFPTLSLASSTIYPPRPDPREVQRPVARAYRGIGPQVNRITRRAQESTLAGYRLIDPFGRVLGGSGEVGTSLAHIEEVAIALTGVPVTRLRRREAEGPKPPVWSVSRRSSVRVFVAMPAVVDGHVIGVAYANRTPGNVVQYLYLERANLLRTGTGLVLATLAIGFVFWRFITTPIYRLIRTTRAVAAGDAAALKPLGHYGTKEVAMLGQSFLSMAESLQNRADSVSTFTTHVTHELKSPITSVLGAAELLRDEGASMSEDRRRRFLDNIAADAGRMSHLLDQLRRLAMAREDTSEDTATLADSLTALRARFPDLALDAPDAAVVLPLSQDNLTIVLTHLAENAVEHGADTLTLTADMVLGRQTLTVSDNGSGIAAGDAPRIFDPFFTTRRDAGGTGMGLGIVAALLASAGGDVTLDTSETGAAFRLSFPL